MNAITIKKEDLKPDYHLIKKEDFEAFLKTVNGLFYRRPHNNSCACRASFELKSGVKVTIVCSSFNVTPEGTFYGRVDEWTHVRLSSWLWENIHMVGKGARSEESHTEVKEIMGLLAEFE